MNEQLKGGIRDGGTNALVLHAGRDAQHPSRQAYYTVPTRRHDGRDERVPSLVGLLSLP